MLELRIRIIIDVSLGMMICYIVYMIGFHDQLLLIYNYKFLVCERSEPKIFATFYTQICPNEKSNLHKSTNYLRKLDLRKLARFTRYHMTLENNLKKQGS